MLTYSKMGNMSFMKYLKYTFFKIVTTSFDVLQLHIILLAFYFPLFFEKVSLFSKTEQKNESSKCFILQVHFYHDFLLL